MTDSNTFIYFRFVWLIQFHKHFISASFWISLVDYITLYALTLKSFNFDHHFLSLFQTLSQHLFPFIWISWKLIVCTSYWIMCKRDDWYHNDLTMDRIWSKNLKKVLVVKSLLHCCKVIFSPDNKPQYCSRDCTFPI